MFNTDTLKSKLSTELQNLIDGLEKHYLVFSKPNSDNKRYEVSSSSGSITSIYFTIVNDEKLFVKFSSLCSMYFPREKLIEVLGINQDELTRKVNDLKYKERSNLLRVYINIISENLGLDPIDINLEISCVFSNPSLSLSINMTGLNKEKIDALGSLLKISNFLPLPEKDNKLFLNEKLKQDPDVFSILDLNMSDVVGDYDVPEDVLEWSWVKNNASFTHRHNGDSGIWEFMLNIAVVEEQKDIPKNLVPIINKAISKGCSYILFNQGT